MNVVVRSTPAGRFAVGRFGRHLGECLMVRVRVIRRQTVYLSVAVTLVLLGILIAWAVMSRSDVEAYFPLSPGSWWVYHSEDSDQASYRQDVLYSRGGRAQIRVDNRAAVQMKVYLVDRSAVTLMHTAVVRDEKTESYLDRPPNTNRVLLKVPLRVGAKWVSDGWLHEVVSVTDRVETPAGIFVDCLRIRATSPDGAIVVQRYHKKGIGIVRTEYTTKDRTIVTNLVDFRVR